jgi:hypothetical protein
MSHPPFYTLAREIDSTLETNINQNDSNENCESKAARKIPASVSGWFNHSMFNALPGQSNPVRPNPTKSNHALPLDFELRSEGKKSRGFPRA